MNSVSDFVEHIIFYPIQHNLHQLEKNTARRGDLNIGRGPHYYAIVSSTRTSVSLGRLPGSINRVVDTFNFNANPTFNLNADPDPARNQ
jgi:hypothetical protein